MAALERFGAYNDTITALRPHALGLKVLNSDLVDIATELQYNQTITSLDLSNIAISHEAATALGQTLGERNACGVQHLRLVKCSLNAACVAPLAAALARNPLIEVLELAENPLRDEGAEHVARMLEVNGTLRTLDLAECKIGATGSAALAGALTANKRLKTLVLRNNKLREAGATALCQGLRSSTAVVAIDLSGNSINREGGLAIAAMLKENTALESINLGKNFLSDSVPQIASAMCSRGKPARLLDLSCNRITSDACKNMSQILEGHRFSVACVSMERNEICDDGLVALYHALKGTGLQFLDLSETKLGPLSGVVIADLIAACPLLNSLALDGNDLGDDAVVEIAGSVGDSASLASLNVERTGVGSIGTRALAAAIANKKKLRQLIIGENHSITPSDVVVLADALAGLRTLESLDLSDLGLDDDETVLRALCGVVLANPNLQEILLEHNGISSGMPHSCLTRDLVASLVDPRELHNNNPNFSGSSTAASSAAVTGGASGTNWRAQSSSALGTTGRRDSRFIESTFRPAWGTIVPMQHAELLVRGAGNNTTTEDEEAEDGAHPPLDPAPHSLHHRLYPGFGHGRFSNACVVQSPSDPVPYSVAVSKGERPPFVTSCDGTQLLHHAPRRPLKYSPYSLIALERNPEQLPVTEDQLRRKFNELDVDANGYLDREEFKRIYASFQNFGMTMTEREVDDLMKRQGICANGHVAFDEFCILMLKLAQR